MKTFLILIVLVLSFTLLAGCSSPETGTSADPDELDQSPEQVLSITDPESAPPAQLCSDPEPALVTDFDIRKPPALAEPVPRDPYRDPVFGSCIVRITDRERDLPPGAESRGLKNEYSRVQSFNADGSYILLYGTEGEWYLYSAPSLTPIAELPLGVEPRWDSEDPQLIYFMDETRLKDYNIATGQGNVIHDFAKDLNGGSLAAVWTRYEGRPSMDTRYWGLMAEDEEWLPVGFLVYDRQTDQVTVRDMRGVPGIEDEVDHTTISPLGTYFLASFDRYCEHGQPGSDSHPCGLMVYDRDLTNGRSLMRTVGHYDPALDAQGNEVIVFQDIDNDQIAMLDLESGEVTPLWNIDFSHTPIGFHFSGLAYDLPGWALVSTYSGGFPDAFTWMDDQVFAVELKAGGRVVRLAHTHSLVDEDIEHDYWAEPQASVNSDFTRILFTSNWGRSGTEGVETYMIALPQGLSGE